MLKINGCLAWPFACLFWIFSTLSNPALAKGGVESAQLDYVALDSSVECNRIFFQSTQHFRHTLFVIPRVEAGSGIEGARKYSISPGDKPGTYRLSVRLYFPSSDEALKSTSASVLKRDFSACNWDEVKHSINKNIRD